MVWLKVRDILFGAPGKSKVGPRSHYAFYAEKKNSKKIQWKINEKSE